MENKDELIKLIGVIQGGILRLKNNEMFAKVNFSNVENNDSFILRVYDCPMWYNWKEKTITSVLGFKVTLDEKLSSRLLKTPISTSVKFPKIEHEGKLINLEVYCYLKFNKPIYKYIYSVDNFYFSQSNLNYSSLLTSIKSLLTNKPITRRSQVGGFMTRLNSLSPNFGKSFDFDN